MQPKVYESRVSATPQVSPRLPPQILLAKVFAALRRVNGTLEPLFKGLR